MSKRKVKAVVEEVKDEEELAENEEFISDDDIDIEVFIDETDNTVTVKFSGFENEEDSEEYAEFLAETLPLLLFETTRVQ
jgi:hypothetical protein